MSKVVKDQKASPAHAGKAAKVKGPIPNFPKIVKKKEVEVVQPLLFFGASKAAIKCLFPLDINTDRQRIFTCAENALLEYAPAARPILLKCAEVALQVPHWRAMNTAEERIMGDAVTAGLFKDRLLFWGFVKSISTARFVTGVSFSKPLPSGLKASEHANLISKHLGEAALEAKGMVAKGANSQLFHTLMSNPDDAYSNVYTAHSLSGIGITQDAIPEGKADFYQPLQSWTW